MQDKIIGWNISVTWDNGEEENIYDIPKYVATAVDKFLTELEEVEVEE